VTVVAFEDKRMDQTVIGTRRDNSAFVTTDNVAQWISKALADELARNGMQVSYSISVNEARKGNPDFLVTGQIDEANIRETSATDMSTSLRANYVLANRQARIMRESLNASQSRTGLPSGSAADNLMLALAAMTGMLSDLTANRDRLEAAAGSGFSTATDLADWLVRKAGLPFRDAHHVTGALVAMAEKSGVDLPDLTLGQMQSVNPAITDDVYNVLGVENSVRSRTSHGGTAPDQVRAQIARWKAALG